MCDDMGPYACTMNLRGHYYVMGKLFELGSWPPHLSHMPNICYSRPMPWCFKTSLNIAYDSQRKNLWHKNLVV